MSISGRIPTSTAEWAAMERDDKAMLDDPDITTLQALWAPGRVVHPENILPDDKLMFLLVHMILSLQTQAAKWSSPDSGCTEFQKDLAYETLGKLETLLSVLRERTTERRCVNPIAEPMNTN